MKIKARDIYGLSIVEKVREDKVSQRPKELIQSSEESDRGTYFANTRLIHIFSIFWYRALLLL